MLASSVYHLTQDVLYATYRYYWDDWNVQSHTIDFKYRNELGGESFWQPHLRYYTQTAAKFFTLGLINGAPLPDFASSDQRLEPVPEPHVRADLRIQDAGGTPASGRCAREYIRQFQHLNLGPSGGGGGEEGAPATPTTPDAFPPLDIGTLTAGYTVSF